MKKQTSKVGIFGLIGNLFLLIIKLIFGYLFNSQAMIADAINSATDCISSFIIIIGGKISVRPKTVKHNVGHGKAEYLFSMFVSLIMIFLSIKIVIDGVISIIHEDKVIFSFLLVVVCFITIITKIFLYLYAKKIYKKENSVLVKSAMIDHRNDCLITTLTLTSIILSYLNLHWANGLFGIFIAFYIFKEGITIFEESYRVLVDTSLDTQSRKKIFKLIDDVEGVVKSDNLATIPIGDKYIAVVTIWVCGELSTAESHRIADRLKKQIEKEMPIIEDVFVHVHPDEK